jgi:GT2 family glycosyltransferase
MNFSFVILHYNALSDTVECIDSIKHCVGKDCHIVVVDNKSPNGSGPELAERYKDDSQVTVILNPENEGFARGNNVGFRYAKQNQNPDFIVMLNNDTLILQKDFAKRVELEYEFSHFDVLGPIIKTPHKPYCSNPGPNKLPSESWYKKYIRKVSFKLFLNRLFGLDAVYELLLRKILGEKEKSFEESLLEHRAENVILHGSFLIFSRNYISKFDGLNNRTFLYHEERLLFLRLLQNGMKSVFTPEIEIFHKEDAATKTVSVKGRLKRRFQYIHYIRSARIMLDVMRNGEKGML